MSKLSSCAGLFVERSPFVTIDFSYFYGGITMKKILKIAVPIIVIISIAVVIICTQLVKPVNLDFSEEITIHYQYANKNINTKITYENDFAELINICKGVAINDFSIPSCGFGTVEIIFEGNGKRIVLYPACDKCSTMRIGEQDQFFYSLSEADRDKLEEILLKYDVTFPCV
jgi:hypothetical protein